MLFGLLFSGFFLARILSLSIILDEFAFLRLLLLCRWRRVLFLLSLYRLRSMDWFLLLLCGFLLCPQYGLDLGGSLDLNILYLICVFVLIGVDPFGLECCVHIIKDLVDWSAVRLIGKSYL
jgi:hypothetical protein